MSQTEDLVRYNHEYERRLKACFVGAGGHAFRNVYPAFRYAPVELLAVCDLDEGRARDYARQFGAGRAYSDVAAMLEAERPEAVFIVTSYEPDGAIQSTPIALQALAAGAHVWMEKPSAASVAEVRRLMAASEKAGKAVMTGLKKIFFPAVAKVKAIISDTAAFGRPSSIYVRYPQGIPRFANRGNPLKMLGLLDHIYHPAAILQHLMGPIERMTYEWEPACGASVASLRFVSGAVGSLHLAAGASGSSPLERLEVVGEGANVVLDNGVNLTYYRRAPRPDYGRAASFLVDDAVAPLTWAPEFSLGQLYNSNLFTLGYAQEVRHFCEAVLAGRAPDRGTLAEVLEIMTLFEAYQTADAGRTVVLQRAG